jgi:nitroreductase
MRKYDLSGGRTTWRFGIIEAIGIAQLMIMMLHARGIGFVPWVKRHI